jgi:cell division septation protein DedD
MAPTTPTTPVTPRALPAPGPAPQVAARPASAEAGGYVVQVSSQRTEADAQASYRALQAKYPAVLGSRRPTIKRADLGEKGIFFRAQVGPFAAAEEAGKMCNSLKAAGGQCIVQRN